MGRRDQSWNLQDFTYVHYRLINKTICLKLFQQCSSTGIICLSQKGVVWKNMVWLGILGTTQNSASPLEPRNGGLRGPFDCRREILRPCGRVLEKPAAGGSWRKMASCKLRRFGEDFLWEVVANSEGATSRSISISLWDAEARNLHSFGGMVPKMEYPNKISGNQINRIK